MKKKKYSPTLSISKGKVCVVLVVADIIYIEACGNNVTIHMRNGEQEVDSKRIGKFLLLLDPIQFHKISRSCAVNILEVGKYEKGKGGNIFMKNGKTLTVAVREKSNFTNRMKKN